MLRMQADPRLYLETRIGFSEQMMIVSLQNS